MMNRTYQLSFSGESVCWTDEIEAESLADAIAQALAYETEAWTRWEVTCYLTCRDDHDVDVVIANGEANVTGCEGWRCGKVATDERTRDDGTPFRCCDEHAGHFDAHRRRYAGYSPEFLAAMQAEASAERELESRVS